VDNRSVGVIIHTNMNLAHQVKWAEALYEGLQRQNVPALITADQQKHGEYHIVLGPHYAEQAHIGKPRVLKLDRAYYGSTDVYASIGWLNADGSRDFRNAGSPPDRWQDHAAEGLVPEPSGDPRGARVLFGDYRENRAQYAAQLAYCDYYRPHPDAPAWPDCPRDVLKFPLTRVLKYTREAIGYRTTALVTTALAGVATVCNDRRNPVYQIAARQIGGKWSADTDQWRYDLAYSQWHLAELAAGIWWERLSINYET